MADINPVAATTATLTERLQAVTTERAQGRRPAGSAEATSNRDLATNPSAAATVQVSDAAQARLSAENRVSEPVAVVPGDNSPAGRLAQQFNALLGDEVVSPVAAATARGAAAANTVRNSVSTQGVTADASVANASDSPLAQAQDAISNEATPTDPSRRDTDTDLTR